ncbi:MAG: HAD-IA family hydrolase [Candidatus Doudnabacteria bacterium]|nr:HAD-IA family hydrolase [Candidatus Doudnabacteria bacterium]
MNKKMKLIIVDYYGVLTRGSYRETCMWLAKKYKIPYAKLYDVIYYKYFNQAAMGKISEKKSLEGPIQELGLNETPESILKKHISFQVTNKSVFKLMFKLQKEGYKILILSKNTPPQFKAALKKLGTRKYFRNIINTFDLRLAKGSKKTMQFVLRKFKVKPQQAVFIDDQDFNLIEAKKMGVKTIHYQGFRDFQKKLSKYLSSFTKASEDKA